MGIEIEDKMKDDYELDHSFTNSFSSSINVDHQEKRR